jgi:peroxiredoxin
VPDDQTPAPRFTPNFRMMKYFAVSLFLPVFLASGTLFAQGAGNSLPAVNVEDLQGGIIQVADLDNGGKPMVISFWATWCKPCIKELDNIRDVYDEWQEETGVKVIAVSIDDARNASLVTPFVKAKGWEYEMYLDKNSDMKRAMNVVNVPHTFLFDGRKEVVYQHTSYAEGDEEELYERIRAAEGANVPVAATEIPASAANGAEGSGSSLESDSGTPASLHALLQAKDETLRAKTETIRAQQEALDAKTETIRALQSENKMLKELIDHMKADR